MSGACCGFFYRGITNFLGYESGAQGQLNAAVEAYMELDRIVQAEGARASAILKDTYHSALLGLATTCYTRYSDRRELLQAAPATEVEREIRADLDRAVAASERAADGSSPTTRASALAVLGSCYACRFEDDVDFNSPDTINTAVNFLREAAQLAEAVFRDSGGALESAYNLRGIRDRLAGALAVRNTVTDVDEAIALYTRNRAEMPSLARDITAGEAVSLAVAWIRRWLLTGETADRERAREAYTEAFASGEAEHLPRGVHDLFAVGGPGLAGAAVVGGGSGLQQATRVMHLAVRQQGSRADREWVVKKAPGVAARAALGLARAGALDDALITLETGRAVLLAEMFDRRALDYQQACHSAEFRVIWLPGAEATRPQFRRALSQFEVLHFAGHAHADPDPLAGGLLLARDECLTIRELLASGIGAARFAVLSACDTARVEDLMSDEMVSFPTALMQCGFGGVIGSLWAASDRPTTMLMKAFYREWRGNATSPRLALRAAQQWTRDRRYASPLAWANFVYVGP